MQHVHKFISFIIANKPRRSYSWNRVKSVKSNKLRRTLTCIESWSIGSCMQVWQEPKSLLFQTAPPPLLTHLIFFRVNFSKGNCKKFNESPSAQTLSGIDLRHSRASLVSSRSVYIFIPKIRLIRSPPLPIFLTAAGTFRNSCAESNSRRKKIGEIKSHPNST